MKKSHAMQVMHLGGIFVRKFIADNSAARLTDLEKDKKESAFYK